MRTNPLDESQWPLVMAAIDCPRIKLLFYIGVKTGLRISELLSIKQWQLDGDCISIERRHIKGKRASRTIPINKKTQDRIRELKSNLNESNCEYAFPFNRVHVYRVLKRAAKKAGVTCNLGTHGMRKTFAKKVFELSGRDLLTTKTALGHKSIESTISYLELEAERLTAVYNQI